MPMTLRPVRSSVVVFVALAGSIAPAYAQSSAAASQQLFQDGTTLLKAGKVHEACVKFGESQKLDPQLGTLLNLAVCHEREGKTATSWAEYTELAAVATKKGDQKRATYAKGKLAELEKQLARAQLDAPPGTNELTLDGVALGQGAWSVPLPLDPGEHIITYAAPSKKRGTQRFTAVASQTTRVALPPLQDEPAVSAPAPTPEAPNASTAPPLAASNNAAPETPRSESKAPRSTLRTVGYGVGAIGVVGLGLGGVFGAMAFGAKSDVSKACTGSQCSQPGLDAADTARKDGTISTVSFIAGGVCLAAGVTMILLGGKKTQQVGLVPVLNADSGGLVGFGTF